MSGRILIKDPRILGSGRILIRIPSGIGSSWSVAAVPVRDPLLLLFTRLSRLSFINLLSLITPNEYELVQLIVSCDE